MEKIYESSNTESLMALFGSFDANIKLIEREMDVRITNRGGEIRINGENAANAYEVISRLMSEIENGTQLTEQSIRYTIFAVNEGIDFVPPAKGDYICITANGKSVKCKTFGQKEYIQKMHDAGGVVTVELYIYPDGTLDKEQIDMLANIN